jgi:AcrR family transcriptional regulator
MNDSARQPRREQDFAPIGNDAACLRWVWTTLYAPDGVSAVCSHCRTVRRFHRVSRRRAYSCDSCGTQVYPAAGTFMQGSSLGTATWFRALALLLASNGGITARSLAVELAVSEKTARRMKQKLDGAAFRGGADAVLLERLRSLLTTSDGTVTKPASTGENPSRTRESIRAAACRAFAAHGQSATRIADIAREAGVSSAIIHYYYRSKDEVLLAALQWADEQTSRRLDELWRETVDPVELLCKSLEMAIPSEGVLRDEYVLWIETWARIRFQPRLLRDSVNMSVRWARFLEQVVEKGSRAGVFHPVALPAEIAQRLAALGDGLAFRSAVGDTTMNVKRVRAALLAFAAEQVGIPVDKLTEF